MTSLISSTNLATSSPRTQINARIAAAVSSGEISSTDQAALSTALDSIDQSLASSNDGSVSEKGVADKINSLIDGQVSAGTLNDDQASELKAFFEQGPSAGAPRSSDGSDRVEVGSVAAHVSSTGVDGMSGPSRPGGPHDPPPPPPSSSDGDSSSTVTTSSSSSDNRASSLDEKLKGIETMIEKLRQSLADNSTYGSSSGTASTGLVFQGVA